MQIGTKELKNRLSHYLRQVRAGERILVADRGKVIAELRAVAERVPSDAALLRRLAADGLVTLPSRRPSDFVPIRARKRARGSSIVIEDRG